MSELREECFKCLNNQNCLSMADYGSLYCMTRRKFKMPEHEDDSIYAIKFAVMKKQLDEKDKRIKELEDENRKLKVVRSEYAYGYENTYFITKNDLVQIDKNKYLIEIEEGKFVDLKQVYLDNKNGIPKQKIKELKENIHNIMDKNSITRAYQIVIDEQFKELLQESEDI